MPAYMINRTKVDATSQALAPLLTLARTWGRYADAVARWENITGRPAPTLGKGATVDPGTLDVPRAGAGD